MICEIYLNKTEYPPFDEKIRDYEIKWNYSYGNLVMRVFLPKVNIMYSKKKFVEKLCKKLCKKLGKKLCKKLGKKIVQKLGQKLRQKILQKIVQKNYNLLFNRKKKYFIGYWLIRYLY